MGMYINSATSSMALTRSLYQTSVMQTNIMKRLSSGIRINSASDDAAGLSLSQKLTSVINGNTVAKNNAQTGISFLNTADGALSVMTNSLERIRNLAVQAANGVYSSSERQMLQNEVQKLTAEIKQGYQSAKFSDKNVFGAQETAIAETPQLSEAQAVAAGYNDAHIIRSATDFTSKIIGHESESFILVNNVDFSSSAVFSDAIIQNNFSGTLDGNGYSVSNFRIASAANDNFGLIATSSGTIKNLSVNNASITAANADFSGIIVGSASAGSLINCSSSGSISAKGYIGGVAGITAAGVNVSNCSSSATVSSSSNIVGGVVGQNSGTISNSNSSGIVTSGALSSGGIVGLNFGTVKDSSSSATVNASTAAGGVVGYSMGTITGCSASGSISADMQAGGLLGSNDGGTVSSCYSTGSVTSTVGQGGGFVGINSGTITNCYSTGAISGGWDIGGFAGHDAGGTSYSYTTSNVTGGVPAQTGGFEGNPAGTTTATNFYKNNMSTDNGTIKAINANTSAPPTSSWDTKVWDTTAAIPALKNVIRAFGSATTLIGLQIGDDSNTTSKIDINTAFGLGSMQFNISDKATALSTISQAEQMMTFLNTMRSNVGSSINKLSSVINIQDSRILNISASKSTINDSDMAVESANLVKSQIRNQAATTLMAQTKNLDKNLLMSLLE